MAASSDCHIRRCRRNPDVSAHAPNLSLLFSIPSPLQNVLAFLLRHTQLISKAEDGPTLVECIARGSQAVHALRRRWELEARVAFVATLRPVRLVPGGHCLLFIGLAPGVILWVHCAVIGWLVAIAVRDGETSPGGSSWLGSDSHLNGLRNDIRCSGHETSIVADGVGARGKLQRHGLEALVRQRLGFGTEPELVNLRRG